jgi:hypothetical protein
MGVHGNAAIPKNRHKLIPTIRCLAMFNLFWITWAHHLSKQLSTEVKGKGVASAYRGGNRSGNRSGPKLMIKTGRDEEFVLHGARMGHICGK